ncbi:MAG: PqqD family peptide modification chaperone [Candidatus Tagabacteria bacterium]
MENQWKISPRVGWRLIDNEIVAFSCANQLIVIWNETASYLWKMLNKNADFDELVNWLMVKYHLKKNKAKQDITAFLREAVSLDFIRPNSRIINNVSQNNKDISDGENVLLAIEMKAIEKLIPFAITFETTYACNENCIHCYMERNLPALSLSEIKRILGEIATEGCLFISFTGGEFFSRRDMLDIVDYAASLHFVIDILSNGTLVNRDIAETLAKYSVRRAQISLYGVTPEIHDSITRLSGSFQRTLKGIKHLRDAGIKVEIAFSLMSQNFHERYLVRDLTKSMDCLISPSHIITARNNGLKDTFSLRLNKRQLKEFLEDESLSGLYAGRKAFKDHQLYFGFSDLLDAAPCYSGFNSCAITPSGKVLPCNQLLYEVGDLKEQTFSNIWSNSFQLEYLRSLTLRNLKKCANCKILSFCARCPGLAFLEGGDLLGPSPENCRVAEINFSISKKGGKDYGEKEIHSAGRQDEGRYKIARRGSRS